MLEVLSQIILALSYVLLALFALHQDPFPSKLLVLHELVRTEDVVQVCIHHTVLLTQLLQPVVLPRLDELLNKLACLLQTCCVRYVRLAWFRLEAGALISHRFS